LVFLGCLKAGCDGMCRAPLKQQNGQNLGQEEADPKHQASPSPCRNDAWNKAGAQKILTVTDGQQVCCKQDDQKAAPKAKESVHFAVRKNKQDSEQTARERHPEKILRGERAARHRTWEKVFHLRVDLEMSRHESEDDPHRPKDADGPDDFECEGHEFFKSLLPAVFLHLRDASRSGPNVSPRHQMVTRPSILDSNAP
jgi:hypothetical protein